MDNLTKNLVRHIDLEYNGDCFFSDYVLELVTKVFAIKTPVTEKWKDVLNADLTFNLTYLDVLLDRLLATKDVSYEPECTVEMNDYLEQVVPVIRAVFMHYDQVYQSDKTGKKLLSIVEPHLYWLSNWKQYFIDAIDIALSNKVIFKNDISEEPIIRNILALSIIASGIEQALGNLILTQSHFVPPLLKTLLTMSELEALIDIRLIRLLKVIVGPPITINLRNILWHGFVNTSSCFENHTTGEKINIDHQQFIYFILAISCSIGAELCKESSLCLLKIDAPSSDTTTTELKSLIIARIPQRKLYGFEEFAFKLEHVFPAIDLQLLDCENFLQELLLECPLIHRTLRPLWTAAFSLYFDTQHCYRFYSFCLLMPLLESSFRYLYCSLNKLSNRLLTAISREYYVTFAEIFSYHAMVDGEEEGDTNTTAKKVNRLFDLFPRPLMVLLLDTIILPEGLRFRDRLSHGQVDLRSLNCTVANHIIGSVIAFLQMATLKLSGSEKSIPPLIHQITDECIKHYECLFHPVYQLKSQLLSLVQSLQHLVDIYKSSVDSQPFGQYSGHLETHMTAITSIEHDLFEPYIANSDQLVLLLRNCTTHYERFIDNLATFISTRSEEIKQCKLRSRQRANYQAMLASVPVYLRTFASEESAFWRTLLLMVGRLEQATLCWAETESDKLSLEKLLKRLLQCAENLSQQSLITVNRWEVVARLINQQSECLQLLYSKMNDTKHSV